MFTIKHIAAHSFSEFIWEAPSVRYGLVPCSSAAGEPANTSRPQISFETEGGATGTISDGIVYVMNRFGATIAKYDLRLVAPGTEPAAETSMQHH